MYIYIYIHIPLRVCKYVRMHEKRMLVYINKSPKGPSTHYLRTLRPLRLTKTINKE